jgi:g-D-glutamyl-meso-diaminopimelate peptidase
MSNRRINFCDIVKEMDNLPLQKHIIGKSVLGCPIFAYGNLNVKNCVLITGGMHAREWITTLTVCELIKLYKNSHNFVFVPLCNPDMVRLAMDTEYFKLWKANANGVDINVNFDAGWGTGKENVNVPGPANYIGPYPNSEPETQALVNLVNKIQPKSNLAFHSKGEVIFYGYEDFRPLAQKMADASGYIAEESVGSAGGLSDWTALKFCAPSFTAEVGAGNIPHPITEEQLPRIMKQVWRLPEILCKEMQQQLLHKKHKNC